jgi:hypothetical protein
VFQVKVEVDLSQVRDSVANWQKQARYATAVALTRTAWDVAGSETQEVGRVFDRPTPQTQKSFVVDKATKDDLTATVSMKTRAQGLPADEYLDAEVVGGRRAMKRSEIMLQAAGILPAGMQTAPGTGAKLDAYGNMARGQMAQILSYFQTYGITVLNSPRMNMTAKKTAAVKKNGGYFVVSVDGTKTKLAPGIWMRDSSGGIKPILMFIRPPSYKKRFDFEQVGAKQVVATFNDRFEAAWADAVRTAR